MKQTIKQTLATKYGYKNVSVKSGRGTASAWVDIKIKVANPCDRPIVTNCSACARLNDGQCRRNKNRVEIWRGSARQLESTRVHKEARELLKDFHFSTFTSDDGYDTKKDCVIIDIVFI